ncbi:MAG: cell division protein FtsA [Deltaproteobacteria bacterium]|jgi:cell division protein FtsA|nr:cell division protein FtsA [Deltaproteobacteria bacterium]
MAKRDNIVVGLDIGTTKICCIVGEVTDEGIDIIGIGTAPSTGLRKGVVINIASTVTAIRRAVEEAELMAGCDVQTVFTGISGGHIRGFNSHGIVAVKDGEITQADVARVIDAAKAVAIPMDREVIHILPQQYIIDDQDGIKEPLGMHGVRLEAKVHIVTAAGPSAQNIIKCANSTGLSVGSIVLQQLASAEAVLTEDEKDLGVCLVDIGGGTADIAIFSEGAIVHTSVLPIGGNHLTTDIALGIRTPQDEAERIKQNHGCALVEQVDPHEEIEVPSVGGRKPRMLSRHILCEIIEARVEEIFQLVRDEIRNTAYEDLLASGVVLTGGTSKLAGINDIAEDVLGLPIRVGYPKGIGGLVDVVRSPGYATAVGLVKYGAKHLAREYAHAPPRNLYQRATKRMGDWLKEVL